VHHLHRSLTGDGGDVEQLHPVESPAKEEPGPDQSQRSEIVRRRNRPEKRQNVRTERRQGGGCKHDGLSPPETGGSHGLDEHERGASKSESVAHQGVDLKGASGPNFDDRDGIDGFDLVDEEVGVGERRHPGEKEQVDDDVPADQRAESPRGRLSFRERVGEQEPAGGRHRRRGDSNEQQRGADVDWPVKEAPAGYRRQEIQQSLSDRPNRDAEDGEKESDRPWLLSVADRFPEQQQNPAPDRNERRTDQLRRNRHYQSIEQPYGYMILPI